MTLKITAVAEELKGLDLRNTFKNTKKVIYTGKNGSGFVYLAQKSFLDLADTHILFALDLDKNDFTHKKVNVLPSKYLNLDYIADKPESEKVAIYTDISRLKESTHLINFIKTVKNVDIVVSAHANSPLAITNDFDLIIDLIK
ncbi:hypothetical protein ACMHYK_14615 [Candidatus Enterenecus avicola]